MPLSLEEFKREIVARALISREDLDSLLAQSNLPSGATTEQLARKLVALNKLTKFQAQSIHSGRGSELCVGDYLILDKLGAGGMGQVYRAQHLRMRRLVALKLLSKKLTRDPAAIRRFERESEAAGRLAHENIVAAFSAGEHEGTPYLVLELIDGEDLHAIINKRGPLAIAEAVNYFEQAARGLAYAHQQGVVHRDIKPANLLVDRDGKLKILDMGLARLEQDAAGLRDGLTQSGQLMGTVDYMAPEQAVDTRVADARSDLYSLGCSLYKLLTGEPPFPATTIMSSVLAHRETPAPILMARRPEVPPWLENIFQRLLAKQPDARFASADALLAAIAEGKEMPLPSAGNSHMAEAAVGPVARPGRGLEATINYADRAAAPAGDTQQTGVRSGLLALQDWLDAASDELQSDVSVWEKPRVLTLAGGLLAAAISVSLLIALVLSSPTDVNTPSVAKQAPAKPTPGTASVQLRQAPVPQAPVPQAPVPPATNKVFKPALAISPFDEAAAKKYQQAWGDYLGLPVEKEVGLPGGEKMSLVLIPPGEFLMGSTEEERAKALVDVKGSGWGLERVPSEGPQHSVRITQPFYLSKYKVQQSQWQAAMGNNPSKFKESPAQPVERVSWEDIQPFLAKLNEGASAHAKFVLPTEAQWEYACRAGTATPWHHGDNAAALAQCAWFKSNSDGKTHPVGLLQANGFGLYDMHGNSYEWCADWHARDYYATSPHNDPVGPPAGSLRVLRGGAHYHLDTYCRSASRNYAEPGLRASAHGVRLAMTIDLTKFALPAPVVEAKTSSSVAPPPKSVDRLAAEFVLSRGGKIWLGPRNVSSFFSTVESLPASDFSVFGLDLNSRDGVNDEDLMQLAPLTRLEYINLGGIKEVTSVGLERFFDNLVHPENLLNLYLGYSQIEDPALRAVGRCTNLETLSLSSTKITDTGLEHLAPLVKLQEIDCFGTPRKGKGLLALNSELKTLGMGKLNSSGFESLKRFSKLERLFAYLYELSPEQAGCIATLTNLRRLTITLPTKDVTSLLAIGQLESLELDHSTIDRAGMRVIATMPRLRRLRFFHGKFATGALSQLAAAPSLESITFLECKLDETERQLLLKAKPGLKITGGK